MGTIEGFGEFVLFVGGMYVVFRLVPKFLMDKVDTALERRDARKEIERLNLSSELHYDERARLEEIALSLDDRTFPLRGNLKEIKSAVGLREYAVKNREAIECAAREHEARVVQARSIKEQRRYAAEVRRQLVVTANCPYCSGRMVGPHADYIVSLFAGGKSLKHNMVFICGKCNGQKGSVSLEDFADNLGFDYKAIRKRLQRLGKHC
jgi:5-methylcytosine-specific restriction endonuclease McrA